MEYAHHDLPRQPVSGLIGPNGLAWEAFEIPEPVKLQRGEAKFLAASLKLQQARGYEQVVIEVGGQWFTAERFHDNLAIWDGLELEGEWREFSCFGYPWQHEILGSFRKKRYALYIRWRHDDPWRGWVVDIEGYDLVSLYRAPHSPNLLPTEPPEPRAVSAIPFLFGSLPQQPSSEEWIIEDDLNRAKKVMVAKADGWLREHVNDGPWSPPT